MGSFLSVCRCSWILDMVPKWRPRRWIKSSVSIFSMCSIACRLMWAWSLVISESSLQSWQNQGRVLGSFAQTYPSHPIPIPTKVFPNKHVSQRIERLERCMCTPWKLETQQTTSIDIEGISGTSNNSILKHFQKYSLFRTNHDYPGVYQQRLLLWL